MDKFIDLFKKKNPLLYIIFVSVLSTILILNLTIDYAFKLKESIMFAWFSVLVFAFFGRLALKHRIWEVK